MLVPDYLISSQWQSKQEQRLSLITQAECIFVVVVQKLTECRQFFITSILWADSGLVGETLVCDPTGSQVKTPTLYYCVFEPMIASYSG